MDSPSLSSSTASLPTNKCTITLEETPSPNSEFSCDNDSNSILSSPFSSFSLSPSRLEALDSRLLTINSASNPNKELLHEMTESSPSPLSPNLFNFSELANQSVCSVFLMNTEQAQIYYNEIYRVKYPNLIDGILDNKETQILFEMLISQCGWYDSRFFDSKDTLTLYHQVVWGSFVARKSAAKRIYSALLEKQYEQETKNPSDTEIGRKCLNKLGMNVSLTQIADISITIFGDYITSLLFEDSGCFLIEHLWRICSDYMKIEVGELLLSNYLALAKDRKGNYMLSALIKWLHDKVTQIETHPHDLQCMYITLWNKITQVFGGDIHKFYLLCHDEYSLYVLKNFVKYTDSEVKFYLLKELSSHGYLSLLSRHSRAKHIIKHLQQCS